MAGTAFSEASWAGYDERPATNPSAALTDFTLLINIANLSASWKSNVQSDGADIRVTKGDGTTELAYDLIDWAYNAGSPTGWLRVLWSGSLASSGTQNVRVYAGYTGGTAVAYGVAETYGQHAAYDASWAAYWPLQSDVNDRTTNGVNLTATGSPTIGGVAGKFGNATDLDGSTQYFKAVYGISSPSTIIGWINLDGTGGSLFLEYNGTSTAQYYRLRLGSAGVNTSWYVEAVGASGGGSASTPNSLWNGVWRHFGGAFVSTTSRKAYLDGVAGTPNTTDTGAVTVDTDLGVTVDPRFNTSPLDAQIQDFQIHSTERSPEWIAEEYAQTNDNASFWGTWSWVEPSAGASATVAATTGGISAAASASFAPGTKTASVAATTGGISAAVAASHTPPTFDADVAVTTGGVGASASATFASAAGVSASVDATIGGVSAAATATFAPGTKTAAVDITTGGVSAAVEAAHTAPTFSADVAVTTGGVTVAASAAFTPGTKTATAALTTGGVTAAASATFAPGTKTATVTVVVGGASAAVSASHTAPTYTASAEVTIGAVTVAAVASNAEVVVPKVPADLRLTGAGFPSLRGSGSPTLSETE